MLRRRTASMFGLRKLLFEAGLVDCPPVQRRQGGPLTRQGRLAVIGAPEIRAPSAPISTPAARAAPEDDRQADQRALGVFGEFLTNEFPELASIDSSNAATSKRSSAWTATRTCRGNHGDRPVGPFVAAHAAISVRGFLDDITAWGWPQAPARQLFMFTSDIPKQPTLLPRALAPDVDASMSAVAELDDLFARVGLTDLRGTGLRIGELLDLEFDAIVDYGPADWVRLPLGKLNTERVVPLDRDNAPRHRRVVHPSPPPASAPAPTQRATHRFRVRRSRPAPRDSTPATRPPPRRTGSRADRAGRATTQDRRSPTPPHLRDHPRERRHVAPSLDDPARPRQPGNERCTAQARLADLAHHVLTQRSARSAAASRSPPSSAVTPSRTTSTGCGPRCSRPASPTAIAPGTSRPRRAPTRTSATLLELHYHPQFVPAITAQPGGHQGAPRRRRATRLDLEAPTTPG